MDFINQFNMQGAKASFQTPELWLADSALLEQEHPRVRILARRLADRWRTEAGRAVACFEYVQSLQFAFAFDNHPVCASKVVHLGSADAVAKATLLVAMLHSLDIPARFHFVDLPSSIFHGLFEEKTRRVTHCFTEVMLGGRWLGVDAYLHDPPLAVAARVRLLREHRVMGYGLHLSGHGRWSGLTNAFGSFCEGDSKSEPVEDWGVFSDPAEFAGRFASTRDTLNFADSCLKWMHVAAANHRVVVMRASRRH